MNDFDQWMKRLCMCKHYGRYVDDFYVVHHSRNHLKKIIALSSEYLRQTLDLVPHPHKCLITNVLFGVDFLGAYLKPHRIYMRHSTGKRMQKHIQELYNHIHHTPLWYVKSSINSYLGYMKQYATHKYRGRMFMDNYRWHPWGIFNRDCTRFYYYNRFFSNAPLLTLDYLNQQYK